MSRSYQRSYRSNEENSRGLLPSIQREYNRDFPIYDDFSQENADLYQSHQNYNLEHTTSSAPRKRPQQRYSSQPLEEHPRELPHHSRLHTGESSSDNWFQRSSEYPEHKRSRSRDHDGYNSTSHTSHKDYESYSPDLYSSHALPPALDMQIPDWDDGTLRTRTYEKDGYDLPNEEPYVYGQEPTSFLPDQEMSIPSKEGKYLSHDNVRGNPRYSKPQNRGPHRSRNPRPNQTRLNSSLLPSKTLPRQPSGPLQQGKSYHKTQHRSIPASSQSTATPAMSFSHDNTEKKEAKQPRSFRTIATQITWEEASPQPLIEYVSFKPWELQVRALRNQNDHWLLCKKKVLPPMVSKVLSPSASVLRNLPPDSDGILHSRPYKEIPKAVMQAKFWKTDPTTPGRLTVQPEAIIKLIQQISGLEPKEVHPASHKTGASGKQHLTKTNAESSAVKHPVLSGTKPLQMDPKLPEMITTISTAVSKLLQQKLHLSTLESSPKTGPSQKRNLTLSTTGPSKKQCVAFPNAGSVEKQQLTSSKAASHQRSKTLPISVPEKRHLTFSSPEPTKKKQQLNAPKTALPEKPQALSNTGPENQHLNVLKVTDKQKRSQILNSPELIAAICKFAKSSFQHQLQSGTLGPKGKKLDSSTMKPEKKHMTFPNIDLLEKHLALPKSECEGECAPLNTVPSVKLNLSSPSTRPPENRLPSGNAKSLEAKHRASRELRLKEVKNLGESFNAKRNDESPSLSKSKLKKGHLTSTESRTEAKPLQVEPTAPELITVIRKMVKAAFEQRLHSPPTKPSAVSHVESSGFSTKHHLSSSNTKSSKKQHLSMTESAALPKTGPTAPECSATDQKAKNLVHLPNTESSEEQHLTLLKPIPEEEKEILTSLKSILEARHLALSNKEPSREDYLVPPGAGIPDDGEKTLHLNLEPDETDLAPPITQPPDKPLTSPKLGSKDDVECLTISEEENVRWITFKPELKKEDRHLESLSAEKEEASPHDLTLSALIPEEEEELLTSPKSRLETECMALPNEEPSGEELLVSTEARLPDDGEHIVSLHLNIELDETDLASSEPGLPDKTLTSHEHGTDSDVEGFILSEQENVHLISPNLQHNREERYLESPIAEPPEKEQASPHVKVHLTLSWPIPEEEEELLTSPKSRLDAEHVALPNEEPSGEEHFILSEAELPDDEDHKSSLHLNLEPDETDFTSSETGLPDKPLTSPEQSSEDDGECLIVSEEPKLRWVTFRPVLNLEERHLESPSAETSEEEEELLASPKSRFNAEHVALPNEEPSGEEHFILSEAGLPDDGDHRSSLHLNLEPDETNFTSSETGLPDKPPTSPKQGSKDDVEGLVLTEEKNVHLTSLRSEFNQDRDLESLSAEIPEKEEASPPHDLTLSKSISEEEEELLISPKLDSEPVALPNEKASGEEHLVSTEARLPDDGEHIASLHLNLEPDETDLASSKTGLPDKTLTSPEQDTMDDVECSILSKEENLHLISPNSQHKREERFLESLSAEPPEKEKTSPPHLEEHLTLSRPIPEEEEELLTSYKSRLETEHVALPNEEPSEEDHLVSPDTEFPDDGDQISSLHLNLEPDETDLSSPVTQPPDKPVTSPKLGSKDDVECLIISEEENVQCITFKPELKKEDGHLESLSAEKEEDSPHDLTLPKPIPEEEEELLTSPKSRLDAEHVALPDEEPSGEERLVSSEAELPDDGDHKSLHLNLELDETNLASSETGLSSKPLTSPKQGSKDDVEGFILSEEENVHLISPNSQHKAEERYLESLSTEPPAKEQSAPSPKEVHLTLPKSVPEKEEVSPEAESSGDVENSLCSS